MDSMVDDIKKAAMPLDKDHVFEAGVVAGQMEVLFAIKALGQSPSQEALDTVKNRFRSSILSYIVRMLEEQTR